MISFSVIIPTFNEERQIEQCIATVRAENPAAQIIVADGYSADRTVQLARQAAALVTCASRGRGSQCNVGAAAATGDVLLFLHADTCLPENAFDLLQQYFKNPDVKIGAFRIRFDQRHWLLRICTALSRFDTIMTSFGDQCIVVRRSFFVAIGGYPDWPLFEDVKLLQEARHRTRVRKFPAAVTSSARRFRDGGFARQMLRDGWYMLQYRLGVSPYKLAAQYERIRSGTD